MFELKFDPSNKPLAAAIGRALMEYGGTTAAEPAGLTADERAALITATIDDGLATYGPDGERLTNNEGDPIGGDCPDVNTCPTCEQTYPLLAEECPHCAATTTDTRVDTNNVPFNDEFCGEAEQPFYASGKRSGQWKKKRGVDDPTYDAWYTQSLADIQDIDISPYNADGSLQEEPLNTAGAFGGGTDLGNAPAAPTDCGQFMAWVSELQAAKRLTQDQVGAAYVACELTMTDLFPPNTPETVAVCVAALYDNLSAVAAQ